MGEKQAIHSQARRGFSMIDTVLALFVVSTMVLLFGSLAGTREINRRALFRAQAAALVDEQINAIRQLGFVNIPIQTNGSFHNVLYNAGNWQVTASGKTGNGLELAGNASMPNAISGRMALPAGTYGASTLEAAWKAATDSPSDWAVGYLFHAQDKNNGYRLRIAATATDLDVAAGTQNLVLDKLVAGVATTVFTKSITVNTNTWYTLRLVLDAAPNPTVKIYIDGNQQDTNNITDATYTNGSAALLGWGGVHAYVDDIQTVGNSTETWNFNASLVLPAAWIRLGLNDLPDATPNVFDDNGKMTIAVYPNINSTSLKQVTVVIEWRDGTVTRNYTSTVLIGKSDLGV